MNIHSITFFIRLTVIINLTVFAVRNWIIFCLLCAYRNLFLPYSKHSPPPLLTCNVNVHDVINERLEE
jgi:hypothetical protein